MTEIYDQGVQQILWLQQFSPAFDWFFLLLTALGDEPFFLVLLPLVYWSVERRMGARLAVLLLISITVNTLAKMLINEPRPFTYDPRVQPLVQPESAGFPSGHAQNTTVLWLYLSLYFRRAWLWVLAGLLLILVPLSRLYLGVHFPTDLLGGYLIGLLVLWLFLRYQESGERWLAALPLGGQWLVAVIPPVLILIFMPTQDQDAIAAAGALLGMGSGFALERRFVGFEAGGRWGIRVLRFVLAAAVLVVIYLGLRIVLADLAPMAFWRFTRYALLGLWAAVGAPWLFVKMSLAGLPAPHRQAEHRTLAPSEIQE